MMTSSGLPITVDERASQRDSPRSAAMAPGSDRQAARPASTAAPWLSSMRPSHDLIGSNACDVNPATQFLASLRADGRPNRERTPPPIMVQTVAPAHRETELPP